MSSMEAGGVHVRIRPDFGGFRSETVAGVKNALRGVQAEVAEVARANVAATQQEIAANRELAASYTSISAAAARGSEQQIVAARLAAEATAHANAQVAAVKGGGLGAMIGGNKTVAGIGAATVALYALRTAFRAVVVGGADFETNMNVFRAVSQASAEQMKAAGDEAKALGADISLPKVSAADAAQAMTELAKGGVSVQDALSGARGTLQLAAAGMLDNATAAGIVAQQLNVFGLAGKQAGHVADLLAGAANLAQGEVSDMAIALQQSAAVARQAGYGIEDTVSAIALLAKNGLIGSDAGTSLRTTFLRLVPQTKQARDQIAALGIQLSDAKGRLLPLATIFEHYRQVLAQLTPVQQQQALTTIFGTDAIRAASIFAREGAAGFDSMREAVDREGAASDFAAARTAGLAGSFGALKSNLQTIAINISEKINPALKDLTDNTNAAITSIADNATETRIALEGLAALLLGITRASPYVVVIEAVIHYKEIRDAEKKVIDKLHLGKIGSFLKADMIDVGKYTIKEAKVAAAGIKDIVHGDLPGTTATNNQIYQKKHLEVLRQNNLAVGRQFKLDGLDAGAQFAEGIADAIAAPPHVHVAPKIPKAVQDALDAAQQGIDELKLRLSTTIRDNAVELTDSINQSKQSLQSIGQSLATTISAAIDAPFVEAGQKLQAAQNRLALVFDTKNAALAAQARRIQALQDKLAPQADALQREQARLALHDDKLSLSNLRRSVILPGGGGLSVDPKAAIAQLKAAAARSPATRAAIEDFIKQYEAALLSVKQDQLSLKQGDLTAAANRVNEKTNALGRAREGATSPLTLQGDRLRVHQDAAEGIKKRVTRQINDLTVALSGGKIGLGDFNARIAKVLASDGVTYKTAGATLGLAFREGFEAQAGGLLEQARVYVAAIAKTGTRAGTGQKPKIVDPLHTMQQNTAEVAALTRQIGTEQTALLDRIAKATEDANKKAAAREKKLNAPGGGRIVTPAQKNPGDQSKTSTALAGAGTG